MTIFVLGLIIFFGTHLWTAFARAPREKLIGALGELGYKGLYSIAAAAGLALIIIGWRSADVSLLYPSPTWTRHIVYPLMLLSLIALAAAYLPAGKIAAALKHPMLAGVKLWAFAHLLVNGEVRSVMLFGAFLAFGVVDRIAVKRRNAPVPAPGPIRNDLIAVVVGAGAWAAIFFYAHRFIAGVALV